VGVSLSSLENIKPSNLYIIITDSIIVFARISGYLPSKESVICSFDNINHTPRQLKTCTITEIWLVQASFSLNINNYLNLIRSRFSQVEDQLSELHSELHALKEQLLRPVRIADPEKHTSE